MVEPPVVKGPIVPPPAVPPPPGVGGEPPDNPDGRSRRNVLLGIGAIVLVLVLAGAGLGIAGVFSPSPRSRPHDRLAAQRTHPARATGTTHAKTTTAADTTPATSGAPTTTGTASTTASTPSTTTTGSTTPGGGTPTSTTSSTATPSQSATFTGTTFSIAYPMNWLPSGLQQHRSYGTDTLFVSPSNSQILLRIDVTPHLHESTPLAGAQGEITAVAAQPGYRQIALRANRFGGFPGEYWEFVDVENGATFHKADQFVLDTATRTGYAVLTQAPAADWSKWRRKFATMRRSLSIKGSSGG